MIQQITPLVKPSLMHTQLPHALAHSSYSHAISWYWRIWALVTALAFLVMEFTMLALGRPQDTLSAQVWRWIGTLPGQHNGMLSWTALHFLFIGFLILLDVWLIGHFGWGLWT